MTNTKVQVGVGAASPPATGGSGGSAEISERDARRLLGIVLAGVGSSVTWRRAQIVLLAAQALRPEQIGEVAQADSGIVRSVIENFDRDGFGSLEPGYRSGRAQTFGEAERAEIRRVALSDPRELGHRFPEWSISRLAEHLVGEGLVDDISHEHLEELLAGAGIELGRPRATDHLATDPIR